MTDGKGDVGYTLNLLVEDCTELSKYYARIQTSVAHGLALPTAWLAGHRSDDCFQTLTLLFQVIFRVDGHVHRNTFAKWRN